MSGVDQRRNLISEIERIRASKTILYVTGDRRGLETRIGQDVIDLFVDHLDALGPVGKITLILYTSGGDTSAAWNLVNLLHMFCDQLEVIAPGKCMSAGTLISLGADRVVMTKQATLGPIDPTIHHPLGPMIPGAAEDSRVGVSVEAVMGYLEAIRACRGNADFESKALLELSNKVHPLVLGQIFRSQQQIRNLAHRLLVRHTQDDATVQKIIEFLCSESGSHDYTINRREAADLGLNMEKCSNDLYQIVKELRISYTADLELKDPYDINAMAVPGQAVQYSFTRALLESSAYGAHHFVTEGELIAKQLVVHGQPDGLAVPQIAIRDDRKFEGWREI